MGVLNEKRCIIDYHHMIPRLWEWNGNSMEYSILKNHLGNPQ